MYVCERLTQTNYFSDCGSHCTILYFCTRTKDNFLFFTLPRDERVSKKYTDHLVVDLRLVGAPSQSALEYAHNYRRRNNKLNNNMHYISNIRSSNSKVHQTSNQSTVQGDVSMKCNLRGWWIRLIGIIEIFSISIVSNYVLNFSELM